MEMKEGKRTVSNFLSFTAYFRKRVKFRGKGSLYYQKHGSKSLKKKKKKHGSKYMSYVS
jgi:hypothetical protein